MECNCVNDVPANRSISIYQCPTARFDFPGKQDYGGIIGTSLAGLPLGDGPDEAFGCGAMVANSEKQPFANRFRDIRDGLSTTLCIAESVDRSPEAAGVGHAA